MDGFYSPANYNVNETGLKRGGASLKTGVIINK